MSTERILYSFRRCPYAIRARLALAISETPYELREVRLSRKPAAMLEASPKGTVPVLVLADGSVIDESSQIMRWALDRNDPEGWLERDDPALSAMMGRSSTISTGTNIPIAMIPTLLSIGSGGWNFSACSTPDWRNTRTCAVRSAAWPTRRSCPSCVSSQEWIRSGLRPSRYRICKNGWPISWHRHYFRK